MQKVLISAAIALVLWSPSLGVAQPPPSAQELALRLNLDDLVRVEDASGVRTTGRLTGLTVDDIAIQTDAGEKQFARDTVQEVAVRGYSLRKAAIIGAGVFAVLGAVANCSHEGGGACIAIGSLVGAPVGAGLGLVSGALIPRMTTVYRTAKSGAPVSQPPTATGVRAGPLADLALRINLDDQLEVEDQAGVTTIGRLTRLTADEITIRTPAGERSFRPAAVRRVAVRRQPLRPAVLIGAATGAAIGAVAACAGSDREECADAPIMLGAVGAGAGLALGALIHRITVVYPEPARQAIVSAAVSRSAIGVRASLRW